MFEFVEHIENPLILNLTFERIESFKAFRFNFSKNTVKNFWNLNFPEKFKGSKKFASSHFFKKIRFSV